MKRSIAIVLGVMLLSACQSIQPNPDEGPIPPPSIVDGVYTNDEAGFRLSVPADVEVNVQDRHTETGMVLNVNATRLEDLDEPLGYGGDIARENQAALAKGGFGPDMDFLVHASRQVVPVGDANGKSFMVLRRFEVCDVAFDRILVFYRNGFQIVLTLQGAREPLVASMPDFFTTDPVNCREAGTTTSLPVWKEAVGDRFYHALARGDGSPLAQRWFTTFDDIVKSIVWE